MSRINNYEELVMERKRLEFELRKQKNILRLEVEEVKQKVRPIMNAVSMLGIFKNKDNPATTLLKMGSSAGIDFLVKDKLLSKAGWLTKTIASSVLKGVSNIMINKRQAKSNAH